MQESDIKHNEEELTEKAIYEVSFLIDSSLSEEEAKSKQTEITSYILTQEGEIIAEGVIDSKKLAYTMSIKRDSKRKDHSKAYFSWVKFALTRDLIVSFEKKIKEDPQIIRHLLITTVRESTLREPVEGIDDIAENVEDEPDLELDPKVEELPLEVKELIVDEV
jgi:ribosomal protein S6